MSDRAAKIDGIDQQSSVVSNADEFSLTLRGRQFSLHDMEIIARCISEHFNKGRTYISQTICEELNWKQPNGWLKERACRDVLLRLERMGVVSLPPALTPPKKVHKEQEPQELYRSLRHYDLDSPIIVFPNHIRLELSKGNSDEIVWNELVRKYHYRGHQVAVGRCIKYLVKTEERLLGAIAFSSPAWGLAQRDSLLTRIGLDQDTIPDLVINNNRFLILPCVQVPNLASTILSLATKQIVLDWTEYYSVVPQIVETFVEPSRFNGTSYRAANWIEIGITKGYAKKGSFHHNSQEPKTIFLYGLNRRVQRNLLRAVQGAKQARE